MSQVMQRKSFTIQEQPHSSNETDQCGECPDDDKAEDFNKTNSGLVDPTDEDSHQRPSNSRKLLNLYKGLLYCALSSVFFCLTSVIVKYAESISPGELSFVGNVGLLIFTLPLVIHSRQRPFGPRHFRLLLILRGLFSGTSIFLRFIAFRYLPIADASVIVLSTPALVGILARIYLKEPCGIYRVFTVLLSLLGIVLITKLPLILVDEVSRYSNDHFLGVGAALGSMICTTGTYMVMRKMIVVHPSVTMFNLGWVSVVETLCLVFITGKFTTPACGLEQGLVILIAIFSFCSQMLLTMSLKSEGVVPVSIVRSGIDIVLAFCWQIWFFNEKPDIYSISGAVLVLFSVVLISFRK